MKHLIAIIASVFLVSACGTSESNNSDVSAKKTVESEGFFHTIDVKPINGGINPSAFAYEISGQIMTGGNRCQAKNVTAKVKQVKVGTEIQVVPYLVQKNEAPRACTREFMPQYQTVKITVRGMSTEVTDVIVKNVGQIGANQNVDALLN